MDKDLDRKEGERLFLVTVAMEMRERYLMCRNLMGWETGKAVELWKAVSSEESA